MKIIILMLLLYVAWCYSSGITEVILEASILMLLAYSLLLILSKI